MSIQDPSPHLAQQQQHQKCDMVRSEHRHFFKFYKGTIFHFIRKMQTMKSFDKRSKQTGNNKSFHELF